MRRVLLVRTSIIYTQTPTKRLQPGLFSRNGGAVSPNLPPASVSLSIPLRWAFDHSSSKPRQPCFLSKVQLMGQDYIQKTLTIVCAGNSFPHRHRSGDHPMGGMLLFICAAWMVLASAGRPVFSITRSCTVDELLPNSTSVANTISPEWSERKTATDPYGCDCSFTRARYV